MEWLTEFHLAYGHLIKPLVVGTLVSLACSIVGCFIILRKLSFLSDAIAHAMSTVAIGGFSTHDASMGFYDQAPVLMVCSVR